MQQETGSSHSGRWNVSIDNGNNKGVFKTVLVCHPRQSLEHVQKIGVNHIVQEILLGGCVDDNIKQWCRNNKLGNLESLSKEYQKIETELKPVMLRLQELKAKLRAIKADKKILKMQEYGLIFDPLIMAQFHKLAQQVKECKFAVGVLQQKSSKIKNTVQNMIEQAINVSAI